MWGMLHQNVNELQCPCRVTASIICRLFFYIYMYYNNQLSWCYTLCCNGLYRAMFSAAPYSQYFMWRICSMKLSSALLKDGVTSWHFAPGNASNGRQPVTESFERMRKFYSDDIRCPSVYDQLFELFVHFLCFTTREKNIKRQTTTCFWRFIFLWIYQDIS